MTNTNYPPKPNPFNGGVNPYPPPADGSLNVPLLRAVREFIAALPVADVPDDDTADVPEDTDPNGWVQRTWRCGTGMCFAGWTVALAGGVFPYKATELFDISLSAPRYVEDVSAAAYVVRDADGYTYAVYDYAQYLLGLNGFETYGLFRGGNNLEDIDDEIDALTR
jgi:hypothetical protein